jgi:hypothetical protein
MTVLAGIAQSKPARGGGKEVVEKEVYAEAQAWQYSGIDLPQGFSAAITSSGEWKINPQWKKNVGAAGNPKIKAGRFYLKPGANEGCLLVRSGDAILHFSRDAEEILVTTPGKIYFCANDEPTQDGFARLKDLLEGKNAKRYADAIPVKAAENESGGSGFLDNTGAIKIRLEVKRSEK